MTFPTADYPGYKNRHTASGDANPPSRSPGAPSSSTRVFLGREIVTGYPRPLGTETYPAGTALVGRGEEVTSEVANRPLYDLWRALDSIADRPRLPVKLLEHHGTTIAESDEWVLASFDPTGGGAALSNDYLVYLGPPGTIAADISKYIVALASGAPARIKGTPSSVEVLDVLSASAGVSLLDPTTPTPGSGYFPEGTSGTLTSVVTTDIESTGGVDSAGNLTGYCIFNYSLCSRTLRSAPEDLWKSFAICVSWALGTATLNHNVKDAGWASGDKVYYTNVALAPVLAMSGSAEVTKDIVAVMSGGWNRVMNGDPGEQVAAIIQTAASRDILPCLEVNPLGGAIFSWDGHNALFRAAMDTKADLLGFVAQDENDDVGDKAFASFIQLQVMAFADATITVLDATPTNQFTAVGNVVALSGGKLFHDNGGAHTTSLILETDLLEVYEDSGGSAGRVVGLWSVTALDGVAGTAVEVTRIDGDITGAGLPAAGWLRVVRPVLQQTSSTETGLGAGLQLVSQKISTTNHTPLTLVGLRSATGDYFLAGLAKQSDGTVTQKILVATSGDISTAGEIHAQGAIAGDLTIHADGNIDSDQDVIADSDMVVDAGEFKYLAARTFYHHLPIASGGHDDAASPWEISFLGTSPYRLVYTRGNIANAAKVYFPVNLPHGATMTKVELKFFLDKQMVTPTNAVVTLYRQKPVWDTEASEPYWESIGTANGTNPAGTPSREIIDFVPTSGSGENVVDNATYEYYVEVTSAYDSGGSPMTAQAVEGIRITYTLQNLKPV